MYKTRKSRRAFANKDLAPLSFPHLDLVPAFMPDMIAYINASPSVFKQKFTLDWVEKAQKIPLNILSNPLENSDHDTHSPSDVEDLATTGDQDSLPDSVDHAPPLNNNNIINTVPRKYPPFKLKLTGDQDQVQDQNFHGLSPIHYDPNVRHEIIYDAKQAEPERNQNQNQRQYKMTEEGVQNDDTAEDTDGDDDYNQDDEDKDDAENWRKKRIKRKQHHHHHRQGRKLRLPTPSSPSRSNLSPPPIPKKILQDQELKRAAFPQLHETLSLKQRTKSKTKGKNKSENINTRTNFVHKMKSFVVQHIQRNSSTIIEPTVVQIQTKTKKRSMGKKASLKNEEDLNNTQRLKNNRKSIRSIKGQLETHKFKRQEQQQKSKIIPFNNNNNKNRIDLPTRFKGRHFFGQATTTTTTTNNNIDYKSAFLAAIADPSDFEPTVTHNETGDDDDDDDKEDNGNLKKNKNEVKTSTKNEELDEDADDLKGNTVSTKKIGVKIKRSAKKKVKRPFPSSTFQTPWRTPWGPINKPEEAIVNTFLEKRIKNKKKPLVKKKRRGPRNKIFPEEDFLDGFDEEESGQSKLSKTRFKVEPGSISGVPNIIAGMNNTNISNLDSKSSSGSTSSFTGAPHQRFPSRKRRSTSRNRNKKPKRRDSLTHELLPRPTPSFYHGIQVHNLFHRDLELQSEVSSGTFINENKELLQTQNKEDPNSFKSPFPLKKMHETPEKIHGDNSPSKKPEEGQKRLQEQQQYQYQSTFKKETAKATRKKVIKKNFYGKLPENPRLLLQLVQNKSIKNTKNRNQQRKIQMHSPMGQIHQSEGMHLKHLHLQGGEGTPRNDPAKDEDKVRDADALLISQGVGSELYSPFEQLSSPNDLRNSQQISQTKVPNVQDMNKKEQNQEKDIILDFMKGHRDRGSDISSSFPFPAREFDYVQRIKPSLARNPRLKWNNKPKPLHLYFESKIMPNNRNYKNIHTLAPLSRREQILKYEFEDNESIILPQTQQFQFNFSRADDFDNNKREKTEKDYDDEEHKNLSEYRFKFSDTSTTMMKIRSHPNLQSVTRTSVNDGDDDGQFLLLHPKPPFNSKEQIQIFNNIIQNNNNSNRRPIARGRTFQTSRKMRSKKTRVRQN